MRALGALMLISALGALALSGVGMRARCEGGRCELAHRSLWSGTDRATFEIAQLESVRLQQHESLQPGRATRVNRTRDPVVVLRDGAELRWYPRRVSPIVELFDPLKLQHHAKGNAPAPSGWDFVYGWGPTLLWAALLLGAWVSLSLARPTLVHVDPEQGALRVRSSRHTLDVSLDQIEALVWHRSEAGTEELFVRLEGGDHQLVTDDPEDARAILEALSVRELPVERADDGELVAKMNLARDNFMRLGVGALLVGAAGFGGALLITAALIP